MINYNFVPERVRFHFYKPNTVVVIGWYREDNPEGRYLVATYGKVALPITYDNQIGIPVRQKYLSLGADVSEEIHAEITLPEDWQKCKEKLELSCVTKNGEATKVMSYKAGWLIKKQNSVEYCIESDEYVDGKIMLSGWAAGDEVVEFSLVDKKGNTVPYNITKNVRRDVRAVYNELDESYEAGFKINAVAERTGRYYLKLQCGGCESTYFLREGDCFSVESFILLVSKGIQYLKQRGIKETIIKIKKKILRQSDKKMDYQAWRKKHEITEQEIQEQRLNATSMQGPCFSVVVPLYKTKPQYLRKMIDSVLNQTYSNLELCIVDGSGQEKIEESKENNTSTFSLEQILKEYKSKDFRVKYKILDENKGIAENTNHAIDMAEGEYVVLMDHDDMLAPNALYECANVILSDEANEVIYTDEDKVDMEGKVYFDPHFKSDYSIDLLCSMNYICHLFVVKSSLLEKIVKGEIANSATIMKEYERSAYDGAQDYDLILRCCEKANKVYHIPKVLYHWRCHKDSTAENPESKLYAFEAGKRAVQAHYDRLSIPARVENGLFLGQYKTIYQWKSQPLISIIIPNKDHIDDLDKCIHSIEEKSDYKNYEIIVVENNSENDETFEYYKELEKRENITVLYYRGVFNYSKINNFGVENSKGEYILLLNNDTEFIGTTTLKELLGYGMREDVGIVGARLYYPDNTIQHAGVALGYGGIAGHTFVGSSRFDEGYMSRIICAQNMSAVTAACMLVRKSVYVQVGGLTEELQVAFNDVDFCLKVLKLGKLIVYNPAAELYHFESKSRGMEDTPEKVERFNSEVETVFARWGDFLAKPDPYFPAMLSQDGRDFIY